MAVNRVGLRVHPRRRARQDQEGDRDELPQPLLLRLARRADSRGARLGPVVRPDRSRCRSTRTLRAARQAGLDLLPALFRRRDDRLGAHGLRPDPVGPGHGRERPGRSLDRGTQVRSADRSPSRRRTRGRNKICSEPKVFFRYASGVVVEPGKGPPFGAVFVGEKGKFTIGRGKLTSDPPELAEEVLREACRREQPRTSRTGSTACRAAQPNADVEIGHRSATDLPPRQHRPLDRPKTAMGPGKGDLPRRRRRRKYLDRHRRKGYELPETV